MASGLTLYGYRFSVYTWIARLALHVKGVTFEWREVDPFSDHVTEDYLALNPFQRVPTLKRGDFVLYETAAITRFIDENFDGPQLQPGDAAKRARMAQIISILDQDGYWPLVRQVFSQGCFQPRAGEPVDAAEFAAGLAAAERVLGVLDGLLEDSKFALGDDVSLADIHMAPMISYFCEVAEGRTIVDRHARLASWWDAVGTWPALLETRPDLDAIGDN